MTHLSWRNQLHRSFPWAWGGGRVFGLLLLLAVLGSISDGWQAALRIWQELRRPVAVYRRGIGNGLALSLNGLEARRQMGEKLPGFDLRGVLLDRSQNDWIVFGETDAQRPGLPLAAVAVAVRAMRLHLEAPGIDIRPRRGAGSERQAVQEVRYFGGVGGTVVGTWFFRFDYWMKRMSLAQEAVSVTDIPIYWHRAVEALEHEIRTCTLTGPAQWTRRNRYWLCAGEFAAIEGDDTLVFENTPLRVLTEGSADETGDDAASPCVSRGTDDPLATEYADWLTVHLAELAQVVPVSEIEDFARLLAGLAWLADVDPYRDLRPWLNAALAPAETPTTVSTLAMQAVREHTVMKLGAFVRHQHRLELSGGVLVAPSLIRARAGDDSLFLLHQVVLSARPAGQPTTWRFTFSPPST